ncbi:hypothetical protein E3J62_07665 [candidate division TA06 bacterium]|uniref:Uncharacterized protein n=1 Tax=candidate division TA06 bacterium TaxID=2250710 RepID=A0A523USG4_UNCT6|nr:MAG: hypothetical protein E3J62_07665 [candidate division TA06 bacterium]
MSLLEVYEREGLVPPRPPETSAEVADPFFRVYEEVTAELDAKCIIGTIQFINERQPALCRSIKRVEKTAEELWQSGDTDERTIQQFRDVLLEWARLHLKGIDLYSEEIRRSRCQRDS